MILEYTLPKFTEDDEMYFDDEEISGLDGEITLPLFDDDDDMYGISITYSD